LGVLQAFFAWDFGFFDAFYNLSLLSLFSTGDYQAQFITELLQGLYFLKCLLVILPDS